ncbi:unnamed protein product [Rotaria sp. Silwood2]|nr:unnamed protein product [Rotaria sp. Silwood2]
MAKDALALIEHLNWHKCHIVGVSMGGMIGLELALLAPHKLLSLSLLATHAGGLAGRAPFVGILHLLRALWTRDKHSQIQNALEMLYSQKTLSDPDKRQYFYDYHHQRVTNCIPPTLVGVLGQISAVQRHYIGYADLLKIRYSPFVTLVIVGTEDRLVRETNSYMLQRVLGSRFVTLEHAGHGLSREYGDKINQALLGKNDG